MVYHHLIPVYAGGPDTVKNGLTLCVNCHLTLHNYVTGDVQIPEDLDPEQEKIFKLIMKYGNIAIEASNKMGMKREEVKKANQKSKKHPMPNANVKMNKAALEEAENMDMAMEDDEYVSEDALDNMDIDMDRDVFEELDDLD